MMTISKAAADELRASARSAALSAEMNRVSQNRHNPFIKAGVVDVDAYIVFNSQFNEFISHEPKKFMAMIDRDMRL